MTAPVREGEILAGKYRVDRVLGVGGMGVVVAAHHIELDDKVAIKFLLPETLGNAEAVMRFAREARAAVKIKSEHVARVSDVGKLANGAPYMVMEYLEGSDLSTWLTQRGALPVDQAVEFILQACEAIAEAHALGIVHRDLKPANLFVIRRPDGGLSVKVLDFGISKMTNLTGSGGEASMTKTSAMMGSPFYMSPEQMQSSKDVDARGDIWALGIILYELITGTPPFSGDSIPALVLQIMSAPPPPIRSGRPDAPDGLQAVILRCLHKDRGKRFQTVGELAVALLPFAPRRSKGSVERISGVMRAAGYSASALAVPPSSDPTEPAGGAGTAASWGKTTTGTGRGTWIAFAGVGVVMVVLVGAIMMRKPAASSDLAGSAVTASPASPPVPLRSPTSAEAHATPSPVSVATEAPGIAVTSVDSALVTAPVATGSVGFAAKPGRLKRNAPARIEVAATPDSPVPASPVAPEVTPVRPPSPPQPMAAPAPKPKKLNAYDDRK